MRAGQRVVLLLICANRDEREFDDPERFDAQRAIDRHLGFGHGVHVCIGAHVARLEGVVLVQELLARCPDYEVVEDGLAREVLGVPRGLGPDADPTLTAYRGCMTQLIIDADTHITEPPDVWTSPGAGEVPSTEVPHVVRNDEGRDVWVLDGAPFYSVGLTAVGRVARAVPRGVRRPTRSATRRRTTPTPASRTWTRSASGRRCSTRTSPASAASASCRSPTTSSSSCASARTTTSSATGRRPTTASAAHDHVDAVLGHRRGGRGDRRCTSTPATAASSSPASRSASACRTSASRTGTRCGRSRRRRGCRSTSTSAAAT